MPTYAVNDPKSYLTVVHALLASIPADVACSVILLWCHHQREWLSTNLDASPVQKRVHSRLNELGDHSKRYFERVKPEQSVKQAMIYSAAHSFLCGAPQRISVTMIMQWVTEHGAFLSDEAMAEDIKRTIYRPLLEVEAAMDEYMVEFIADLAGGRVDGVYPATMDGETIH